MTAAVPMLPPPALEAAERFLSKLNGVEMVSADTWRAECPVIHTATGRFLTVQFNKARTRLHLRCERGCGERLILTALELGVSALYVLDPDLSAREAEAGGEDERTGERRLPKAVCALYAPPAEPVEWAIEDLWTAGEVGLLVGDGGSFKSTAALAMAGAMAGGYPVWGQFHAEQRAVLVVSAEDAGQIVQMRLEAIVCGHSWERERVLSNVHYIATPDVTLANAQWQAHLLNEAIRLDAGLVILDPLADLLDGDENSNSDVRPLIKFARSLATVTGAAVAIVHHAGKLGDGKRSLDRIRGASALNAAARTILFFDYHDTGVTVEHLKMSRAPKLAPFVLTRTITSDPHNRALWRSANLSYHDATNLPLSKGETFVVGQLSHSPGLTTRDLKRAAIGVPGVSAEVLQAALDTLISRGRVTWESGPNKSKLHRLVSVPASVPSVPDGSAHSTNGAFKGGRGVQALTTNSTTAVPFRGTAVESREEQQRSRPGERDENSLRLHREVEEDPSGGDESWRWNR